ncbi:MAG: hypothetical protein JWR32_656 [Mycobacterium sp.]|jgi:hypothetical protein|nr:hypothetical protein [Mycobacterium sp.]
MKVPAIGVGGVTAAALLAMGVSMGGFASAAPLPGDYTTLPIDPNIVTDSLAYSAAPPVQNPNGQPGVTEVYTHRDGTRQISTTIMVLPDPQSATASLNGSKAVNGQSQPAAVGSGGTIVSGSSPDGSKSVSVLTFTEGNAATTVEFDGPKNDPATSPWIVEYGQKQDAAIKNQLAV